MEGSDCRADVDQAQVGLLLGGAGGEEERREGKGAKT
jgi:hypothetical protein